MRTSQPKYLNKEMQCWILGQSMILSQIWHSKHTQTHICIHKNTYAYTNKWMHLYSFLKSIYDCIHVHIHCRSRKLSDSLQIELMVYVMSIISVDCSHGINVFHAIWYSGIVFLSGSISVRHFSRLRFFLKNRDILFCCGDTYLHTHLLIYAPTYTYIHTHKQRQKIHVRIANHVHDIRL